MIRHSIRYRLIKRLLLVLITLAVAANTGLYLYLRGELIEEYDDALQSQARAAAVVWQAGGGAADASERIVTALPDLHFERPDGDYIRILRSDGSTALRVPDAAGDDLSRHPASALNRRHVVYDLTLPNGRAGRAIEIGIDVPSRRPGDSRPAVPQFALILAESRREMDRTLASFAVGLFVIGGTLSVASIWLVLTIVRRELSPLADFSEAVGRLNADSLDYRFASAGLPAELRPMSDRLNDLLQRLGAAFGREKRFTGNVAHELRTPLAELRTMVEVAMKWPPEDLRRHHGNVLEVVQRMSTVTQTLLTLVRCDATRLAASMTPVDLVGHARAAARVHEPVTTRRNVVVEFDAATNPIVSANSAILLSLLDNLFSNAALYSAEGSRITCEIAETDWSAVLCLSNSAGDLTEEDLARLDEPFWRKDPARSPGDHVGLGLTLARAYCEAMSVDLSFRKPTPDRLTIRLSFPLRGHDTAERRTHLISAGEPGTVARIGDVRNAK